MERIWPKQPGEGFAGSDGWKRLEQCGLKLNLVIPTDLLHQFWNLGYLVTGYLTHRDSKGPKMVFTGGRRQKLSFLSQSNSIRSHLSHRYRNRMDKLRVQLKLKTIWIFVILFHKLVNLSDIPDLPVYLSNQIKQIYFENLQNIGLVTDFDNGKQPFHRWTNGGQP